jgi:hypothetical protein
VIPTGPAPRAAAEALDEITATPTSAPTADAIETVEAGGDIRLAWVLLDLLRFHQGGPADSALVDALTTLTDAEVPAGQTPWVYFTDLLLDWDVPAPPDYFPLKRDLYLGFDPDWEPFFDASATIDWRQVTWSGVERDAIVPLDDPEVVLTGSEPGWLPDDDVVYGVVVGDEARAYPRRVLEVHELVNDTVGGRRLALAYCAPCGASIAYFTDEPPEGFATVELASSGLLDRSNKLMYDVTTESLLGQFTGQAITGPLADGEFSLGRLPVVTTTWAQWRSEHPDTTVISEDGGVGRVYVSDPLAERDEDAPLPLGPRDDRLDAHARVLGVPQSDGRSVAFAVEAANDALDEGADVSAAGVTLEREAGGLVAIDAVTGRRLPSHEAYWFAWSWFHPDTELWNRSS